MDYRKTAQEIYDHIGKKENIISAAHCATRLRLVISDNSKADKEYVENIEGVKGVFFAQGQMQIILGTGVVNKVYDEFIRIAGVSESSKEELKKVAASRANPVQRLIKTLGDIFVPIIPAIVASGFLMGIMEALNFMVNNGFLNIDTSGSIYTFAQLFSDGSFYRGKSVAVLGGGDTALDDAVYLADVAEKVYVIHRRKEFRGAAITVAKLREKENVIFVLEHQVKEIIGDQQRVTWKNT